MVVYPKALSLLHNKIGNHLIWSSFPSFKLDYIMLHLIFLVYKKTEFMIHRIKNFFSSLVPNWIGTWKLHKKNGKETSENDAINYRLLVYLSCMEVFSLLNLFVPPSQNSSVIHPQKICLFSFSTIKIIRKIGLTSSDEGKGFLVDPKKN